MNEAKRIYIFSAMLSFCCHAVMINIFHANFILPTFLHPIKHQPVELELVDNRILTEEESKMNSNLIDERASKSRDRMTKHERGLFPASERGGRVKSISDVLPLNPMLADKTPSREHISESTQHLLVDDGDVPSVLIKQKQKQIKKDIIQSKSVPNNEPFAERRARMFKNVQSEVEELGDPSFATQKDELVPYLKELRQKIFEEWFSIVSLRAGVMPDSQVAVEFKLIPDGNIEEMNLLSYQGSKIFPDLCMAAIQQAAPFGRVPIEFPDYMKKKQLVIKFRFYYN